MSLSFYCSFSFYWKQRIKCDETFYTNSIEGDSSDWLVLILPFSQTTCSLLPGYYSLTWLLSVQIIPIPKIYYAGKAWEQKKGATDDEVVRWHHQLNGREFEQTQGDGRGQRSLVCCSPWGRRVEHNLVTEQWQQKHTNLFNSYCKCWPVLASHAGEGWAWDNYIPAPPAKRNYCT